jgi:signal peptide peptidase SppA
MKYEHILTEVFRKPWAILPERFRVIAELVAMRAAGGRLTEEEIRTRLAPHRTNAATRPATASYGAVAVIPIYGIISHRANLMSQISGGTSIEKLTASFRQAMADSSIKCIVFDVDSPGGGVEGVPELADEIQNSRGQKKTVAVANGLAASAAYWLASAANEIVIAPSSQIGSIGVFAAHEDLSAALEKAGVKISLVSAGKYKTEGNPYEPLTEEARAALQLKVDAFYQMFVKSVARGRGVSQSAVRGGFGEGRLVLADSAVKERMADRVATLDSTLSRLGSGEAHRQMSAEGLPISVEGIARGMQPGEECQCDCPACPDDCEMCSMVDCQDPVCAENGCPNQAAAAAENKVVPAVAALLKRRRELDLR